MIVFLFFLPKRGVVPASQISLTPHCPLPEAAEEGAALRTTQEDQELLLTGFFRSQSVLMRAAAAAAREVSAGGGGGGAREDKDQRLGDCQAPEEEEVVCSPGVPRVSSGCQGAAAGSLFMCLFRRFSFLIAFFSLLFISPGVCVLAWCVLFLGEDGIHRNKRIYTLYYSLLQSFSAELYIKYLQQIGRV